MSDLVVPMHSKRIERAQLLQRLQDVVPALVLMGDGVARLGAGLAPWSTTIATLEVASAGVVIANVLRHILETRARRRADAHELAAPHHQAIDWSDVFLAAMLVIEAVAHHEETGHWKRPTLFMAVITLAFGLLHGPFARFVERRRSMHITSEGLRIAHPFRRFAASWTDIASFDVSDREAIIATHAGRRRRIDLADLFNHGEVRRALDAARDRWRETVRL